MCRRRGNCSKGELVRVLVVGNGGHSRACVDAWPSLRRQELVGCVGGLVPHVGQLPLLGEDLDLLALAESQAFTHAFVAVGDNADRRRLTEHLWFAGWDLATLVADSAQVSGTAHVAPGVAVMRGAIVGAGVAVSMGALVNTSASVDHDSWIGPYAHVGPGSHLCGAVTVGAGALLGAGVTVIPGVKIGDGAIVGAGAVVIRDVPPGATVVGVPAKLL